MWWALRDYNRLTRECADARTRGDEEAATQLQQRRTELVSDVKADLNSAPHVKDSSSAAAATLLQRNRLLKSLLELAQARYNKLMAKFESPDKPHRKRKAQVRMCYHWMYVSYTAACTSVH